MKSCRVPIVISLMVAVGAIMVTVTAIVMGAWSDQQGRRKPFILAGYGLWGLTVILFPATELINMVWLTGNGRFWGMVFI